MVPAFFVLRATDPRRYVVGALSAAVLWFVAFYTTERGNRIAFHEYVNQTEESIGDLDMRGDSSGCIRVSTADSWLVWDFLQIGDPVVVITN